MRQKLKLPDQELLASIFSYDPETGALTYKIGVGPAKAGKIAGFSGPHGRRIVSVYRQTFFASRVIWKLMTGNEPNGDIDHINHDPSDDSWVNLRDVSHQENQQNQWVTKKASAGTSWCKRRQKWRATLTINGRQKYLGLYDTQDEAHQIYLKAKATAHTTPMLVDHQKVSDYERRRRKGKNPSKISLEPLRPG